MDKKYIAIIVAVLVLLALAVGVGYYTLSAQQPHYKNITMNAITMEVPDTNDTVAKHSEFYSTYNDTKNHIEILVYDSENAGLADLAEAVVFAGVRDAFQTNATLENEDGQSYNYSSSLGVYSYVGNFTHKNILVLARNKDDFLHILKTMDVDLTLSVNKTNETQNNTTTKKTTTTKKKEREEDKVTSDGWDPKKHETYREDLGEGLERVNYDDGYHRIVDKEGNILSYGF